MENQESPTQEMDGDNIEPTPIEDGNNQEKIEDREAVDTEKSEDGPRKFRVKVSGEEKEVTEDDLIRDYQIKEESFKRMKDATNLMNQVKPFVESLKKGDLSVLDSFGIPREAVLGFSESKLKQFIAEKEMTPEQLEAKQAKEEAEQYKRELEARKQQEQSLKQQQLNAKAAQDIENDFLKVLRENQVPKAKSGRIMQQMAQKMFNAMEGGNENITAQDAFEIVMQQNKGDYTNQMALDFERDKEAFINSLPADIVDGIREYEIKRARGPFSTPSSSVGMKQNRKQDSKFLELMKKEIDRF